MIGFISSLVTHSLLITIKYIGDTALLLDLHAFQFTFAHALGFSVFTSRLLAMDLNTETSTQITTSITPKIFQLHFRYRCTVAHIKSSIHALHLHTATSCIPSYSWFSVRLEDCPVSLSLMLRPTVSRPVYLGIKHPSGAYDQIFISVRNTEHV
jgi:hypothetical protein